LARIAAAMISIRTLWALWVLLVFGLFNLNGPALKAYRTGPEEDLQAVAARLTPLQLFGVLARNDSDTARYFSYANAMLGRPYSTFYVRKLEDWRAEQPDQDRKFPDVTPERPLRPWRDFSMEYPPGMAIFALLPALATRDFDAYHLLFAFEMELLLTLSVFAAVRAMEGLAPGEGRRVLAYALAVMAATGFIAARRYDACLSASLGLTLFALAAQRPVTAGASLAFGIACKGAPALFAPLGALYYALSRRWREFVLSAAGACAVVLFAGAFYLLLAGEQWRDPFLYHAGRPLQIESTFAALLILARTVDPTFVVGSAYGFGSTNIVSAYEPVLRHVAEVASLAAIAAVWVWAAARLRACGSDRDRLIVVAKGICAVIIAFSALGKVFSPQYLVWLTPVAAIACLEASRAAVIALFIGLILSQIEYPFVYSLFVLSLPPSFGLLTLARNGALLIWAWLLLFERRA
jgi:hypothetical protein